MLVSLRFPCRAQAAPLKLYVSYVFMCLTWHLVKNDSPIESDLLSLGWSPEDEFLTSTPGDSNAFWSSVLCGKMGVAIKAHIRFQFKSNQCLFSFLFFFSFFFFKYCLRLVTMLDAWSNKKIGKDSPSETYNLHSSKVRMDVSRSVLRGSWGQLIGRGNMYVKYMVKLCHAHFYILCGHWADKLSKRCQPLTF